MQCNSIFLVFEVLIKSQKKSKEGIWQLNWSDSQPMFSESIILRFEFWLNLIHLCLCISSVGRLCRLSQCVPQNNRPLQLRHWPAKKFACILGKAAKPSFMKWGGAWIKLCCTKLWKGAHFLASSGQADLIAIICIQAHSHYIAGPMKISSCPVRVIGSYWPVVGEVSGV